MVIRRILTTYVIILKTKTPKTPKPRLYEMYFCVFYLRIFEYKIWGSFYLSICCHFLRIRSSYFEVTYIHYWFERGQGHFERLTSSFSGCVFCSGLWGVSGFFICSWYACLLTHFYSLLNWRHLCTINEGSLSGLIKSPPLLLGPRMRLSRVSGYLSHFLRTEKTRSAKPRIRYL